jgi:alpha-ketoglutarate-dependent taurine dioxygenase
VVANQPFDLPPLPRAWEQDSIQQTDYSIDFPTEALPQLNSVTLNQSPSGESASAPLRNFFYSALHCIQKFGFTLCKNWPLASADSNTAWTFANFGALFGDVRAQDGNREYSRFVQDQPNGTSGSTGRMEISLHTENARPPGPPRYIGLLCIRPASSGGESILASGLAIFNRLRNTETKHITTLRTPVPFGRRREDWQNECSVDWQPVFSLDGDSFHFRYSRYWIDLARTQSNTVITPEMIGALNAVDKILQIPDLSIKFTLQPGDALIIDNRVVMHGRRAFIDDPVSRRRLVRIWID